MTDEGLKTWYIMKSIDGTSPDFGRGDLSARPNHFKPSMVVAELAGGKDSLGQVISRLYPGMEERDLTTGDRAYIERNIFWHPERRRWDYHPPAG
jgi:hypothetical protein